MYVKEIHLSGKNINNVQGVHSTLLLLVVKEPRAFAGQASKILAVYSDEDVLFTPEECELFLEAINTEDTLRGEMVTVLPCIIKQKVISYDEVCIILQTMLSFMCVPGKEADACRGLLHIVEYHRRDAASYFSDNFEDFEPIFTLLQSNAGEAAANLLGYVANTGILRLNSRILNSDFLSIAVSIVSTSENEELIGGVVDAIANLMTGGILAARSIQTVLGYRELIDVLMRKIQMKGFEGVPFIFTQAARMVPGASDEAIKSLIALGAIENFCHSFTVQDKSNVNYFAVVLDELLEAGGDLVNDEDVVFNPVALRIVECGGFRYHQKSIWYCLCCE